MVLFTSISVLVVLISSFAAHILAQAPVATEVTLWQFGPGRLLAASVTLPLQPLGTASNGLSTTYLYQAVNPATITTITDGSFTTQTIASATPRTVVASASGWVEPFDSPTAAIACRLVNSSFGECFNGLSTVPANSGKPFAEVFPIGAKAVSTSVAASSTIPASGALSSNADPTASVQPTPVKHRLAVGAIVGVVLGGTAVLFLGLTLCIVLRRRQRRRMEELQNTSARAFEYPQIYVKSDSRVPFVARPQLGGSWDTARGKNPPSSSDISQEPARRGDEDRGHGMPPMYSKFGR
ncbi:hypothetical protein DFH06DRAFT_1189373 [Mycena polygramma]|nr:hypothetical protein DFH06DRAFT_1189373 [Mycena polygramma]